MSLSVLTVACRERVRFPQSVFVTTSPLAGRLVRVFEADVTTETNNKLLATIRIIPQLQDGVLLHTSLFITKMLFLTELDLKCALN